MCVYICIYVRLCAFDHLIKSGVATGELCVCIYIYMYIQLYIYIYIHTCVYTRHSASCEACFSTLLVSGQ